MESLKLTDLTPEDAYLGRVASLNYERAVVVTSDIDQERVGGVPRHCFLLASHSEEGQGGGAVILLSVEGVAELSTLRGMQEIKESMATSGRHVNDPETRHSLQTMGFNCRVMGSFYERDGELLFGADLDRVYAFNSYNVYRPRGKELSFITSFFNPDAHRGHVVSNPVPVELGVVRYSETRQQLDEDAKVFVDLRDILGKKTAVLGATRAGKSNTIKILAQQTLSLRDDKGRPQYGQIIFDPQGEYANSNAQDQGSLASVGTGNDAIVFRLKLKGGVREELLKINFLDPANTQLVWDLFLTELSNGISGKANYIAGLFDISFEAMDEDLEETEKHTWRVHDARRRLGFYALMGEARIQGPVLDLWVNVGKENLADIEKQIKPLLNNASQEIAFSPKTGSVGVKSTSAAKHLFKWIMAASGQEHSVEEEGSEDALIPKDAPQLKDSVKQSRLSDSWLRDLRDGDMSEFMKQFEAVAKGRTGVTASLKRLAPLHDPQGSGDVRNKIWGELIKGRLVIVDLSVGSPEVSKTLSELIMNAIIDRASERFVGGLEAIPVQVIVEEAHNLFTKNGETQGRERDPWVRLAKEAAKYQIGLIYATQEVTSVDPRILANTSNFLVAHTPSSGETKALAGYYSFAEWDHSLRASESKGFVRMKTFSSPYIIPVQVSKFEPRQDTPAKGRQEPVRKRPRVSLEEDEEGLPS